MSYIQRGNFLWPSSDNHCHKVIHQELGDIDYALGFDDRRNVALQAGGNVGVWAVALAKIFKKVYTFEPDPENFYCLAINVPENVICSQVALSDRPGRIGMATEPSNVGAHYINGEGTIPAITIDSLDLEACDYLCLDIEGSEPLALWGAEQTIERFKPLIHIEEKGLSERYYNISRNASTIWLTTKMGYRLAGKVRKDLIFRYAG